MRKYSFEFKKKVVMDYLEGKEGHKRLRKKYGMPDTHQIRTWISSYKKFGDKGIMGSNKNRTYSFEFKLYVVELYLTTESIISRSSFECRYIRPINNSKVGK